MALDIDGVAAVWLRSGLVTHIVTEEQGRVDFEKHTCCEKKIKNLCSHFTKLNYFKEKSYALLHATAGCPEFQCLYSFEAETSC